MTLKVGQRVKVVNLTDETARTNTLGQIGRIVYLDYACGCGQTYPDDPMFGVQFEDNSIEEFWSEELSLVGGKSKATTDQEESAVDEWTKKTLVKVRKARRTASKLRYMLSDVKILLYELEEFDDEHAELVDSMNAVNNIHRRLVAIERKLSHR